MNAKGITPDLSRRTCLDAFWLLTWIIGLLVPTSGHAETVTISTGEYAPFVTQQLQDDGLTAAIVREAFKAQGVDVKFEFLPWKRGFADAEIGKYLGTFPYVKNAEREAAFLYSDPIYVDQVRLFVRKDNGQELNFTGKAVCIPLGYDTTLAQDFIAKHAMELQQPSEMSQCFNMLDAGRVGAVWVSELVGREMVRSLFGSLSRVYPLTTISGPSIKYHFIISRKFPDANKWLTRFNAGLAQIHKNGTIKKIKTRFSSVTKPE